MVAVLNREFGNRKVESAAMQRALSSPDRGRQQPSAEGKPLEVNTIQEDLRTLWKMGSFDDVSAEAEEGQHGGVILYALAQVIKKRPNRRNDRRRAGGRFGSSKHQQCTVVVVALRAVAGSRFGQTVAIKD